MSGDRLAAVVSFVVGLYWFLQGLAYGYWIDMGPGPGFIPVLFGSLTVILSISLFLQTLRQKGEAMSAGEVRTILLVSAAVGVTIFLMHILGAFTSLGLFLVAWLCLLEHYRLLAALKIAVPTILVAYLVFVVWLQVPFPTGFLGF
ncbi:MAG: tripartite tricarboxylate transporter TctB family protein [Desulfofundulus sp.]